jgi:hypothetical protein
MKFILYAVILTQAAVIIYLTGLMVDRTFNNSDMGLSYQNGCNIGRHYINSLKFTCRGSADSYKRFLDRLDDE